MKAKENLYLIIFMKAMNLKDTTINQGYLYKYYEG